KNQYIFLVMHDLPYDSQITNPKLQSQKIIILNSIIDLIIFIIIFQIIRSHLREPFYNVWVSVVNLILLGGLIASLIYFRVGYNKLNNQRHNIVWKIEIAIAAIVVYLLVN
ncbi:MAG: hypothetical protein ACC656_12685, partial [Candidatus Heimdallarchaeota archaeon]